LAVDESLAKLLRLFLIGEIIGGLMSGEAPTNDEAADISDEPVTTVSPEDIDEADIDEESENNPLISDSDRPRMSVSNDGEDVIEDEELVKGERS